jgi:hypothetical protein
MTSFFADYDEHRDCSYVKAGKGLESSDAEPRRATGMR